MKQMMDAGGGNGATELHMLLRCLSELETELTSVKKERDTFLVQLQESGTVQNQSQQGGQHGGQRTLPRALYYSSRRK
jgi:hypothetical protein